MPAPFQFRLNVVLRLRKAEMEREQRAMAGCVNAVLEAQKLVELVAQRINENADLRRDMQIAEHPDVAGLRSEQVQLIWLRRMQEQSALELAKRHDGMEAQRMKLVAASRRVKVIEKLRDRQWKRYQEELRRHDRKAQDEFAMFLPTIKAETER